MGNRDLIKIRGAKTHNLKNINLDLKTNQVTCFVGPSGSGKTSLAFHTLFLESKRRLINSFPTQVKFFWDIPQTVDVDQISPVLPVWGLKQNNPILGSRLNFSDLINVTEDLQKLFYLFSYPVCPNHNVKLTKQGASKKVIGALNSFKDNQIVSVLIPKMHYLREGSSVLPARSFNEQLGPFNYDDPWWEVLRVKTSFTEEKMKAKLEKDLPRDSEIILMSDGELSKEVAFEDELSCSKCSFKMAHKVEDIGHFSPFNALGACENCKGHGNTLNYELKKLIKNEEACLNDRDIHLLNYSKFNHYYESFIKEAKKKKIRLDIPIKSLNKKEVDFLYKGSGDYPGFNRLLSYLESKKYKKNVRIYIRGLQVEKICTYCEGSRLDSDIRERKIGNLTYQEVFLGDLIDLEKTINSLNLDPNISEGNKIKKSLLLKIKYAKELNIGNVILARKAKTLTSGEYQKSLMVKILSYEGSGSLFIFDEPSLGMDIKSQKKFMNLVHKIKDQGNTVIIVDHSEEIQKSADEILALGPGAGDDGGEIVYQGPFSKFQKEKIRKLKKEKIQNDEFISISDLEIYGKKLKKLEIRKNAFNLVVGESGRGKSSFVLKALANELHRQFYKTKFFDSEYSFSKLKGFKINDFDYLNIFEFKPAKGNSRSTIGTKLGISPFLRDYYASLEVSKTLGLKSGHFSPNSPLGKCLECEGSGEVEVDMNFLENLTFTCQECNGNKLRPVISNISDGRFKVKEVFSFSLERIFKEFNLSPKLKRVSRFVRLLKLEYLQIDRKLSSLSGGEQQRFNLLSHLKDQKGRSLIFLENLSFGLGDRELVEILELLQELVAQGSTVVAIDQNPLFAQISQNNINFK